MKYLHKIRSNFFFFFALTLFARVLLYQALFIPSVKLWLSSPVVPKRSHGKMYFWQVIKLKQTAFFFL